MTPVLALRKPNIIRDFGGYVEGSVKSLVAGIQQPSAGAVVRFWNLNDDYSVSAGAVVISDQNGNFSCHLAGGHYLATASLVGYASQTATTTFTIPSTITVIELSSLKPVHLEFMLYKGSSVTATGKVKVAGTPVNSDPGFNYDSPIGGVTVSFITHDQPPATFTAVTDASGCYNMHVESGACFSSSATKAHYKDTYGNSICYRGNINQDFELTPIVMPTEITDSNFSAVMNGPRVFLQLYGTGCEWCKGMEGSVEQICTENADLFVTCRCDGWVNPQLVKFLGLSPVTLCVPQQFLYKNGVQKASHVCFFDYKDLIAWIDANRSLLQ